MKNILAIALLTFATALFAEDIKLANETQFYKAGEFSFDSFAATRTTDFSNHRDGVGFGVGYAITDHSSVAIESFTSYIPGRSPVDDATALYRYRIAVGRSAPYGLIGANYNFEHKQWSGVAGVGLEHRITKNIAPFVEARMIKTWNLDNPAAEGRVGIRLSF